MGKSKKKSKKAKEPQKQQEKSMDDMLNAFLILGNSMLAEDYGMENLIY